MTSASTYALSNHLANVLREEFAGAPGPWTYLIDNRPGVGMLSTIESISAEDASVPAGPSGTTIAGHVNHVRASLAVSTELIKKEASSRDRTGSWTVAQVSGPEWKKLQVELRGQYERSLQVIQSQGEWDEDGFGAALGAIAHVAYHLGVIRQRLLLAGILRT